MIQDDQRLIEKKRREFNFIRQNGKVVQKRRRKRKSDEMKWSQMVRRDCKRKRECKGKIR